MNFFGIVRCEDHISQITVKLIYWKSDHHFFNKQLSINFAKRLFISYFSFKAIEERLLKDNFFIDFYNYDIIDIYTSCFVSVI